MDRGSSSYRNQNPHKLDLPVGLRGLDYRPGEGHHLPATENHGSASRRAMNREEENQRNQERGETEKGSGDFLSLPAHSPKFERSVLRRYPGRSVENVHRVVPVGPMQEKAVERLIPRILIARPRAVSTPFPRKWSAMD
jgi:hypothetical protein